MHVRYSLQIPVDAKWAKRYRLPSDISVLTMSCGESKTDRQGAIRFFSRVLDRLQDQQRRLYAQPMVSWIPLEDYRQEFSESGIRLHFDRPYSDGVTRHASVLTIECDSEEKIRTVFERLKSEKSVFLLSEQHEPGSELERALAGVGRARDESHYLAHTDRYGAFWVFDDSCLWLSGYGKRGDILRTLSTAFSVEEAGS